MKTNSGEAIFSRFETKRGRHGATPIEEGVVAVVDILVVVVKVRARCCRRVWALEAMVVVSIDDVQMRGRFDLDCRLWVIMRRRERGNKYWWDDALMLPFLDDVYNPSSEAL